MSHEITMVVSLQPAHMNATAFLPWFHISFFSWGSCFETTAVQMIGSAGTPLHVFPLEPFSHWPNNPFKPTYYRHLRTMWAKKNLPFRPGLFDPAVSISSSWHAVWMADPDPPDDNGDAAPTARLQVTLEVGEEISCHMDVYGCLLSVFKSPTVQH